MMDTILSEAIKKAGIAIPLNRRVWTWVKDHPGKTSREIAQGINVQVSRVQSSLLDLCNRGMMTSREVYQDHYSGMGRKTQNEYTAVGNVYELMPVRKMPKKQSSSVTVVKSDPVAPVQPLTSAKIDVQSLPLAEARRIYEELKEIFG